MCVEAAIPPLQCVGQQGPAPHRGIAGFAPQMTQKKMKKFLFFREFSRSNVLKIINISEKTAKFDFESDIQKSSFSEKLDKNNWTKKIGLSHPGFGAKKLLFGKNFAILSWRGDKSGLFHASRKLGR